MGDFDVLGDVDIGDDLEGDDILGDADLLGLGVQNLLMPHTIPGALRKAKKAAKARAVLAARAQRGAIVQTREPERSFELPLPCDSVSTIAAGATSSITVTPVGPYRPTAFIVADAIADGFTISDIKMGRKSLLMGGGSLPASMFRPDSPLSKLRADTAQTSQPIVVTVKNETGAALRFMAAFNGTTVE